MFQGLTRRASLFKLATQTAKFTPVFNLNILSLRDNYLNVGQFTRAGVANSPDYQGTLVQSALDQHRVNYGRYDGLGWKDTASTVPLTLTANPAANVAINGSSFRKTGAIGWNTGVTSSESYAGEAYCSAVNESLNSFTMLGLTTDPAASASYSTIDYAIYDDSAAFYKIYENGVAKPVDANVPKALGDVLSITYTGTTIVYKANDTVIRTTAVAAGLTLFLDCALYQSNSGYNDVRFGISETNNNGTNQSIQLHPKRTINGAETYIDIKAWVAGAFNAGDMVETGGRYYQASASGTDVAFNSSGLWVDKGIYNKGFGVLLEGGTTNYLLSSNNISYGVWYKPGTTTVTAAGVVSGATGAIWGVDSLAEQANGLTASTAYTAQLEVKSLGVATTMMLSLRDQSTGSHTDVNVTLTNEYQTVTVSRTTGSGTTALGFVVGGTNGDIQIRNMQVEQGSYATSYVESLATQGIRQNELGNLKFPTTAGWKGKNAFPHASGSLAVTWIPQFGSGDLAAANRIILGLNTITNNTLLGQHAGNALNVRARDFTNEVVTTLTAWKPNDAIQLFVRWGNNADPAQAGQRLQLIFRNATLGETLTYATSAPYDGAFNDTGFLQFLQSLGGNNSVFRNTAIFDRPLTNNELQGYVIK